MSTKTSREIIGGRACANGAHEIVTVNQTTGCSKCGYSSQTLVDILGHSV